MLMLFEFRLWLEDEETYNKKFKPRAEMAAARLGDHPFKQWFPEGGERVVIPLRAPAISAATHFLQSADYLSPEDKQVVSGLKALGYEVTDYRGGYVRRGQGVEKIGGLLEKLIKFAKTPEDAAKYQTWQHAFVNSVARKDKNMDGGDNLWVLISRNAHDIAQMSYDREWTSCMELEDGMYKNTPFCVIKTGGMVAYLLRKPQAEVAELAKDTTKYVTGPIARMSIKAAYNTENKGLVIAVPETRVYPSNIRGFYETVFDWVEQHQGDIGSGKFRVLGGYSDDYGQQTKYRVHHRPGRDLTQLTQWLNSHIEARQKAAIRHILDSRQDYPKEVYEKIKTILTGQIQHDGETTESKQLLYLLKRFPEMFSDQEKKQLTFFVKDKADLLGRHDRVTHDFATKFAKQWDNGKVNKPSPGEIKQLQHHLGEIAEGKAKFKDEKPFAKLVDYLVFSDTDLNHLHSRPLLHFAAVNPHREEMTGQLDAVAESLLEMLGKQNKLGDITDHYRSGISYAAERLLKMVLGGRRLTPELVKKSRRVIEMLTAEGHTYTIRYEIAQTVKQQISHYFHDKKPEVVDELQKLHDWLDKKFPPNVWGQR